jgi:hypothetical protein
MICRTAPAGGGGPDVTPCTQPPGTEVWDNRPMPASTPSSDLSERYGRTKGPSPRTKRVLLVLLAVLFLAGVTGVGLGVVQEQSTSADAVRYDHLDDRHISLTFVVTSPPGKPVTCETQALNEGRAQVGFVSVDLPASDSRQTQHKVDIATQGEAVSAEVISCHKTSDG